MRFIFGLFFCLSLASAVAAAEDVHTIAKAVDNHYNNLRSLQAEFTQIYRGNEIERTESGTLWLKNPARCVGSTVLPERSCF